MDPDAPSRRGGVDRAAVAGGVDAVLVGFASNHLPGNARGPHKPQRCAQPLLFELHVDPLQGDCLENELCPSLVAAGHPHGKGHLAAVGEQAARIGSRDVDVLNFDSVGPDVEGDRH